jgi:hypothetical protein
MKTLGGGASDEASLDLLLILKERAKINHSRRRHGGHDVNDAFRRQLSGISGWLPDLEKGPRPERREGATG